MLYSKLISWKIENWHWIKTEAIISLKVWKNETETDKWKVKKKKIQMTTTEAQIIVLLNQSQYQYQFVPSVIVAASIVELNFELCSLHSPLSLLSWLTIH